MDPICHGPDGCYMFGPGTSERTACTIDCYLQRPSVGVTAVPPPAAHASAERFAELVGDLAKQVAATMVANDSPFLVGTLASDKSKEIAVWAVVGLEADALEVVTEALNEHYGTEMVTLDASDPDS